MRPPAVLLLGAPLPPPYGGIAKYLQFAVPELVRRGYRVHVAQPAGSTSTDLALAPEELDSLVVETLRAPGKAAMLVFVLRNLPSLLPFLIRYLPALLRFRGGSELSGMLAWCMLADRVSAIDIAHAYDYPWSQGAAAVWVARKRRTKSVVSTFGELVPHREELNPFDELGDLFKPISRYVLEAASSVVSMTRHCQCVVSHIGLDPDRLGMVRMVVGMAPFHPGVDGEPVRRQFAPHGEPLLLFVGQVRARKGPQTLIEAMPRVLAEHPRARLLIVGPDHGYGTELRALADRLGVSESVVGVGAVSDDELPIYYAACDAFLFPTLTPIECLGLTFVQAMYAGKPVIATRIAGAPEVIREGQDGYLVEPGSADDFASRIVQLLAMPASERHELGRKGRERVLELFDESAVMNDLVETYERLRR